MSNQDESTTTPWHAESIEGVTQRLGTTAEGLSPEAAKQRLDECGPNTIARTRRASPWEMLWRQLKDPLLAVLIGSGLLAIALGKLTDGAVVLAVVIINTVIGFVQEYRASRAIESLSKLVPQRAEVRRQGEWNGIDASQLVPGDLVRIGAGDKVPADLRLTLVKSMAVDEAMLTGESVPSEKRVQPVGEDAQAGDQLCLAFKGTLVTSGAAEGIVIRTGNQTELGQISEMLSGATEIATPMTRALATLGKQITVAIMLLAVGIMAVGMWREIARGADVYSAVRDTVMFAIALAVGAIPEGLPAIVTIALAIGVRRMAARKAIVRTLPSVETLGSTTVICSDKTGTLTRNEMTVRSAWTFAGSVHVDGVGYGAEGGVRTEGEGNLDEVFAAACRCGALCSDARIVEEDGHRTVEGDPTEGALIVIAEKAGLNPSDLRQHYPRLDAVPFDSERKYMATLHDGEEGRFIVLKGAPEVVLGLCHMNGDSAHAEVLEQVDGFAKQGMRVLAVARRQDEGTASSQGLSEDDVARGDFELLALFGIIDPPRQEAVDSIALCHTAGVTIKMITGDHATTAEAISKELGIHQGKAAISGSDLARMNDDQLWLAARQTNIFARVSPESKLRLVKALQRERHGEGRAEIVAMTGDGVNDAPALKQANIGVAMGITGTSTSQEAADLVLMDDNFATIAAAMEEGRRVYDNLIKSLAFVLPTNLALALILVFAVIFFPFDAARGELLLPVRPTQLLWINLVAAVALALPLAFEAKEPDIMERPPRDPSAPVFSRFLILRTALAATLMCAVALVMFSWHYYPVPDSAARAGETLREAQTLAVTTVVLSQVFYLLNCRSLRGSVLRIGFFSNPTLFAGIAVVLALQGIFIYAPFMNGVFYSSPLSATELALATCAAVLIMPVIGLEKWIRGLTTSRQPS